MEILKRTYYIILILILAFSACKDREEPLEINEEPEFFIKGELDGEPFEYFAGRDGFIMDTYTFIDSDQKTWYAGNFKTIGANDFRFKIAFRNLGTGFNHEIESTFETGSLEPFINTPSSFYEVAFEAQPSHNIMAYKWDFGDGTTSDQMNPVHIYPLLDAVYDVTLNIEYENGCSSVITQKVKPHLPGKLNINIDSLSTELFILRPEETGFDAVNYEWKINDTYKSNTKNIALQSESFSSIQSVCLKALSSQGKIYEKCIQFKLNSNSAECFVNFDYSSQAVQDTIIEPKDPRIFETDIVFNDVGYEIINSVNNSFNIVASEAYIADLNGDPTQKVQFELDLLIHDEERRFKNLIITEAVIAVGIKE